ncbi:hypothetical protein Dda_5896 [Drechslerella dactyloides]|uniref:Uncharacterized protein n=1 Tax=Drechslerella dactyloides TaxID=74499 RepID=A0AAD6NGR0_DREDA|nr:hypothetical protein Dda_5896 [Drechslerella dactyloides]
MSHAHSDVVIAGATAAFTVDLIVYPLDTVKTRIQSPDWAARNAALIEASGGFRRALLRHAYQGVGSVIIATLPSFLLSDKRCLCTAATFFLTYNFLVENVSTAFRLRDEGVDGPSALQSAVHSASSAVAEVASCAILTPAEVIKQNAQVISTTSQATASSSLAALRTLLKTPGSLFRGYSALVSRNLPFTATQFPVYEELRRLIQARRGTRNPSLLEVGTVTAISAASAGAFSAALTTPLDVIKTRMMLLDSSAGGGANGKPTRLGMIGTAKMVIRREAYRDFLLEVSQFQLASILNTGHLLEEMGLLEIRAGGGGEKGDRSLYQYDPSVAITAVALVLYTITTFTHFFQYFRYRAWFLTVFLVAGLMQTLGYLARVFSAREVTNRGLYIGQFTLIILAPILTAAGDYVILGKLLERVLPGGRHAKTLGLRARWITWIFVSSDIFSFLMQGIGAGIISANVNGNGNLAAQERGSHIVMAGLIVQLVFFGFFTGAVVRFDLKTRAGRPNAKWRVIVYCLYISCACILIRSIYRLIEFAQGWTGYLMSHEVYFWILETLPMFICLAVFNVFHPAQRLPDEKPAGEEIGMAEGGHGHGVMEPNQSAGGFQNGGGYNSNYRQLD